MTVDPLRPLAEVHADIERILRGEDITAEPEQIAPEAATGFPSWYGARNPHDAWVEMYERVKHKLMPHEHAFYINGIAARKPEEPT